MMNMIEGTATSGRLLHYTRCDSTCKTLGRARLLPSRDTSAYGGKPWANAQRLILRRGSRAIMLLL